MYYYDWDTNEYKTDAGTVVTWNEVLYNNFEEPANGQRLRDPISNKDATDSKTDIEKAMDAMGSQPIEINNVPSANNMPKKKKVLVPPKNHDEFAI